MEKTFDTKSYIKDLGEELIAEFIKAGKTTHPGSVGSGRETAIRNKLKNILPQGIGVGSGFVVDSFGNTSKQCDIVIYEENYALKFIINEDVQNTYYNCECVIAIGEIKSDASIHDVEDAFIKFKNIRNLKRRTDNNLVFRPYLSNLCMEGTPTEIFEPTKKQTDQIYTFLLCKSLKAPLDAIKKKAKEIFMSEDEYFNFIISIEGNVITYLNSVKNHLALSALNADSFVEINNSLYNFNLFINNLDHFIRVGRTVPINNSYYIINDNKRVCEEKSVNTDLL